MSQFNRGLIMLDELLDEVYATAKQQEAQDPFYYNTARLVEQYRILKTEVRNLRNALRSLERDARQMREQSEEQEL